MAMFDNLRRAMLAGYGMKEQFNEFVDELVKKGELSQPEGANLVKEWSEKVEKGGQELSKGFEDFVSATIQKFTVGTKDDIDRLEKQIAALSARVKELEEKAG